MYVQCPWKVNEACMMTKVFGFDQRNVTSEFQVGQIFWLGTLQIVKWLKEKRCPRSNGSGRECKTTEKDRMNIDVRDYEI